MPVEPLSGIDISDHSAHCSFYCDHRLSTETKYNELTYSQFYELLNDDKIVHVKLIGDTVVQDG